MPESSSQDRTEKPTPHRLRKARQEGQVPTSQEVPSALIMAAMLATMTVLLPDLLMWFRYSISESIVGMANAPGGGERFVEFFHLKVAQALKHLAPFMVIMTAVSLFSSSVVSGLVFSPKALKIDWNRVNPVKGIKNVISLQALTKLGFGLLKLSLITLICYLYFRSRWEDIIRLRWSSPPEALSGIGLLILHLLIRVLVAMFAIAGLDFAFQKWNFLRRMKMTKQEVKEEHKQHEGSPEVRSRVRQMQQELVKRRMMQDVPQADVVLTNPTHYAVALQYDEDSSPAPIVVAKGADQLALKIRQVAKEHGVPVVERPQLARALYGGCEIGQTIPNELFVAVAEVLAMIWRLRRKRRRKRTSRT